MDLGRSLSRIRGEPFADRGDSSTSSCVSTAPVVTRTSLPCATHHQSQLAAIKKKLLAFRDSTRTAPLSTLQEEQERELAPEIEEERRLSRPPPRQALKHSLHPDVRSFVLTGRIPPDSPAFLRSFAALSNTSAASLFRPCLSSFPSDLLVTRDFARTVEEDAGPGYVLDPYQRDVRWVVTSSADGGTVRTMVVVSPWEAGWIKRIITIFGVEWRPHVTLHAYLPRSSLAFRSMEDLTTYTVPHAVAAADWAVITCTRRCTTGPTPSASRSWHA